MQPDAVPVPVAHREHEVEHDGLAPARAVEEPRHQVDTFQHHLLRLVDAALHDGLDAHADGLGLLDEADLGEVGLARHRHAHRR